MWKNAVGGVEWYIQTIVFGMVGKPKLDYFAHCSVNSFQNLKCVFFTDSVLEKKMYSYGRTPFKFHKTNALQFSCSCSGSVSLYLSWA